MRTPVKGVALMGNKYDYGGITLDRDNNAYIVVNGCNKLVCYNVASDSILWSMNAMGYSKFCDVQSICWLEAADYTPHIIMLLRNGEVWNKVLAQGFTETRWGDEQAEFPECRGASGIEYQGGSLYVTFPQFNTIRKLALATLITNGEWPTGVPTQSPYPPAAIAYDGVNQRFVCIDPVKGDLVYLDSASFFETGRERYTPGIYGDCFNGDLAWSKVPLATQPGQDHFMSAFNKDIILYGEPWYTMWEIDDLTGTAVQVDAVTLDNVTVGENVVKHLRLDNMTDQLRSALTLSIADDPTMFADDYTWIGPSAAGPWTKVYEVGNVNGHASVDFYLRFHPAYGIDLGFFVVNLIVDYTRL